MLHLSFVTALALDLPHLRVDDANSTDSNITLNQTADGRTFCIQLTAKAASLTSLVLVYSILRLALHAMQLCFLLHYATHLTKENREVNPIQKMKYFIKKLSLGLSDLMEITLFLMTAIYTIAVFFHSGRCCWFESQWAIGAFVILFSWIELIILCTQFQFVGVYALMLFKVLKSFLKICILLCLLVTAFGLALYLTVPNTVS